MPRPTRIRIRNHSVDGKPYELTVEDYLARIVLHESDHLDGVLYTDHVPIPERLVRQDHRAQADAALGALYGDPDAARDLSDLPLA